MRHLRFCKISKNGECPEGAWFDTATGIKLTQTEIQALLGYTETWTFLYEDGTTIPQVATFYDQGWLNEGDRQQLELLKDHPHLGNPFPKSTALVAVHQEASRKVRLVVAITDPEGNPVDLVRVRYRTGELVTEVPRCFVQDHIIDAREKFGAGCFGHFEGWVYGFGAHRHALEVRSLQNLMEKDRQRAEDASYRAGLAIFTHFGSVFPLSKYMWEGAAKETFLTVEAKFNQGPWVPINGKGKPQEPLL